jgi:AraC-like DNA-binding protein
LNTLGSIPRINTHRFSSRDGKNIPIKQVKPIVKLLSARGMTLDAIIKNTGLTIHDLNRIDIELSPEQHNVLLLNAIHFMPDTRFAADLGEQDFINQDSLLACRIMSSDTVEQGMYLLSQYYTLWTNQFDLKFSVNSQWGIFQLTPQVEFGPTLPFYIEYFYAILLAFGKYCLGENQLPLIYEFSYSAPTNKKHYIENFSEHLRFDEAENRVLIPRALLRRRLVFSNKEVAHTKDQNCRSIIHNLQSQISIAQRAQQLIASAEIENLCLEQVAKVLCLSPRSLRRHLQSEGLQFKTLVDQRKQTIALELVQENKLPLSVIAGQLGYQDLSSFSRAFKRWHGQSPKLFQR